MDNLLDAAFELRMLVLQECECGKFHQVMLTPDEFKRVGDITSKPLTPEEAAEDKREKGDFRPGFEIRTTALNPGWAVPADTFLGLASFYPQKEIDRRLAEAEDKSDV